MINKKLKRDKERIKKLIKQQKERDRKFKKRMKKWPKQSAIWAKRLAKRDKELAEKSKEMMSRIMIIPISRGRQEETQIKKNIERKKKNWFKKMILKILK